MNYLLDSNIIIDFFKGKDYAVDIFEAIENEDLSISIITYLEIMYGIKKNNSKKREKQFKKFLEVAGIRVIQIDMEVGEKYLEQKLKLEKKGNGIDDFDLFIAATAIENKLKLITKNIKHFKRIKKLELFEIGG